MTYILFLSEASARIHANTKNNSQDITATLAQRWHNVVDVGFVTVLSHFCDNVF